MTVLLIILAACLTSLAIALLVARAIYKGGGPQ